MRQTLTPGLTEAGAQGHPGPRWTHPPLDGGLAHRCRRRGCGHAPPRRKSSSEDRVR